MTFMQLRFVAGTLTVAGAFTPSAFGFAEIARGKLIASASLVASYDTNILSNGTEEADFVATFNPSLAYLRNVGIITTSVSAGVKAYSFTENKGYDSLDPNISCSFSANGSETISASISFGYARTTEADSVLLDRVETDKLKGSSQVSYFFREKIGLNASGSYVRTMFNSPGRDDVSSYGLGGGVTYRYSAQISASASCSYNPVTVTQGVSTVSDSSSTNYVLALNFDGELAPKLSGSTSVGYAFRSLESGNSDATMLLGINFNWNPLEKSAFSLSASNKFDLTPRGESARVFDLSLGYQQILTPFLKSSATIGYTNSQITATSGAASRSDDGYSVGLAFTYSINEHWSAGAGITHGINESNLALAVYSRTVVSFTLGLTF